MNKGIGLALVILITPLVVITASTLTFYLGYKPTSTSNNGELIVPPLETNLFKLENNFKQSVKDKIKSSVLSFLYINFLSIFKNLFIYKYVLTQK